MNEQTEKLSVKLLEIVSSNFQYSPKVQVKLVLKTCKEAGLRFVDMAVGYTDEGIEEIDYE